MKFGDKIALSIIKNINVNPQKKDRVVEKFKLYEKVVRLVPALLRLGYERVSLDADGVPIELYRRKGSAPDKLVVIVHGGAFIMGLINTYRNLHIPISKALSDADVAIIDYKTAPTHKYPTAHDDIMTAWKHLFSLGYQTDRTAILGDSSGGNLVLSHLLRLRDLGQSMPRAAVVISPWADLSASGQSYYTNYGKDIIFGRKGVTPDESIIKLMLECGVFSYVGDADRNQPYLSPILGEYDGMPPMLITVGSDEMLLDDSLTIAKKVEQAGGEVRLIIGEGMFHSYPLFYSICPSAKTTFKQILEFLRDQLGGCNQNSEEK